MRLGLIRFLGMITVLVLFTTSCASTQAAPTTLPAVPSPVVGANATATQSSTTTSSTAGTNSSGNSIHYVLVPGKSQALYRVREQLVSLSLPSDAIGTTQDITGTLAIKPDGTIESSESKFSVGLQSLTSDRSQRDNFLRRNVLQTDQYPNVVFVPTQATGLPQSLPQSGQVTFKLNGNLTIRDVTKPVTWDVTCTVQGEQVSCKATTSFKFEDFNLTQPRVPVVLSVVDNIQLELDITLQRASN